MPVMTFRIGDCFEAADPVARFITVLAMISNDWLRLYGQMTAVEDHHIDAEGIRLMSFRHQASLHHEAADFIESARRRFPEVEKFVTDLNTVGHDACERVLAGIDPASPHFLGTWLEDHRNVTFHYAKLHPEAAAHNDEEIAEALKNAADIESTITEDDRLPGGIRFGFADDVAVQWLPDVDALGTEWLVRLREGVISLGTFVREAATAYLESQDPDRFTIE